jgi:hypothetical protein
MDTKYEYIFVSTHEEVREALLDNCIFFYVIYPDCVDKEKYIERFKKRGNTTDFVKLLDEKWDEWLLALHRQQYSTTGCEFCEMKYSESTIEVELQMMFAKEV